MPSVKINIKTQNLPMLAASTQFRQSNQN